VGGEVCCSLGGGGGVCGSQKDGYGLSVATFFDRLAVKFVAFLATAFLVL
jgi:hypothetical protein